MDNLQQEPDLLESQPEHNTSLMNEATKTPDSFNIDWGLHAILKLLSQHHQDFNTVLEIGSGAGEHARLFRYFEKEVYAVDLHHEADYSGDFISVEIDKQFDVLWCSHVLEHQRNTGLFLDKMYQCLKPDGLLAISVPCHPRERIVSGHITSWTPFLLCYNLILAGFDCSDAAIFHDYELSLLVRKRTATGSDINSPAAFSSVDQLKAYFPMPVQDGIEKIDRHINWAQKYAMPLKAGQSIHIQSRWLPDPGLTLFA